ncbi:MAG: sodium:solute symporter family protein [Candidatus Glassbacteria bacterium]|nr:sodium:solute symporter family protein [Candidatus Glassbacteria bacterium]
MLGTFDIAIIFIWLAFMLGLGRYLSRSVAHTDDFYLANRQMPVVLVVCSMAACNLGMYNFISEAGQAAYEGVSIIWHEWTGNMAFAFCGLFIMPGFRRLRLTTIPEFMGLRYGPRAHSITAGMYSLKSAGKLGLMMYLTALAGSVVVPAIGFYWWIIIFTVVVGIYTYEGGMISVIFADAAQFILILIATLIGYWFVAGEAGWLPGIIEKVPAEALNFVPAGGKFGYKFIVAILFLGIVAFCCDQGMIQRSFGSKNVKTLVVAMVLVGIILTPVNPFHFFAGLAAPLLVADPGAFDADSIMTQLYVSRIPLGLLGIFIVGLLASQLSTIDAELNAGATVLAKDVWQRLRRTEPTGEQRLKFSRYMTVLMTVLMVIFAIAAKASGRSIVDNFLSLISVFDTPIFVVAIIFGLKGRRINEQGAVAGYVGGALIGLAASYLCAVWQVEDPLWWTTLSVFVGACLLTLTVSPFFPPPDPERVEKIRRSDRGEGKDWYSVIPRSLPGKVTLGIIIAGALVFISGIVLGGFGSEHASLLAISGMVIYFVGCGTRLLFD